MNSCRSAIRGRLAAPGRLTPFAIAALVCGLVLAPVSSASSGIASESPNAIAQASAQAADSLKTVRVSGTVSTGGGQIGLNLILVDGVGSQGSMTIGGNLVDLVTLGKKVYLKGGAGFWKAFGSSATASLLAGRWLETPGTGNYAGILKLGNLTDLFNQTFATHGKLVKSAEKMVDGVEAIGLIDTTQGGTLYVAATGKPYPLEITNSSKKSGGTLTFTDFNKSLKITAPPGAINLNQLKSKG